MKYFIAVIAAGILGEVGGVLFFLAALVLSFTD